MTNNTPTYLCGWTAWGLWHRLRCVKQPRLDQTETVVHELRRRGLRPAPARMLSAGAAPGGEALPSLVEPKLRELQSRLLPQAAREPRPPRPSRRESADAGRSAPPLPRLSPAAAAGLDGLAPFELLVTGRNDRRASQSRVCRVWGGPLPPASFVPLRNGVYLATPEFVFLQLATRLSLPRLVLLGFEACGFYGIARTGCLSAKRCQPLTSAARLRRFADGAPGAYGVKRARSALRFVLDRSGSVMESAMVALSCLPRTCGGYGLPLPSMNPRINVPSAKRELLGRSWVACDAYWPDARFALEYDGREDHTGDDGVERDYARANDLAALGIATETVTKRVLFHTGRFDKTVRKAAKMIGCRLNARDFGTAWYRKRESLRDDVIAYLREHP